MLQFVDISFHFCLMKLKSLGILDEQWILIWDCKEEERENDMEAKTFLEIMKTMEKLKCNTRHSWTSNGRHESVAEHSWQLAMMAMLMKDEFPEADIDKVIHMCLIHDLGEAITGDIPSFDKNETHEETERKVLNDWVTTFPNPYRQHFLDLYEEMDALETIEAKLYKALDKLEAVIQHNQADINTWIPIEYELQYTYTTKQVEFSEYLKQLKAEIDQQTTEKINRRK